jgi:hypothetical protein
VADICQFPEGQFVWGAQVCGEEAVSLVEDSEGNDGWVCEEHARLLQENSRAYKDLCVGDNDTCPLEIDWAKARPGVDGRCTRHMEEWEADHRRISRRSFLASRLRR